MRGIIYCSRAGSVVVLIGISACTVGPKYHPPVTQTPPAYKESPTQFKETGGWTVANPQDAMLRGKWWEIFKEPELNALEEKLNINNLNI
jgi:outer membrane protein TolC